MVKHTETIRRLLTTNFLSVFDHFVGLALIGLKVMPDIFFSFCFSSLKESAFETRENVFFFYLGNSFRSSCVQVLEF